MQDKDQKLIWESYQDQDGELDFEKLPVDELKRLSPEEAKLAIGMLNKIDIAIQKGTDRMYNDVERAQRNNISGRIKLLNDIISPPPPPPILTFIGIVRLICPESLETQLPKVGCTMVPLLR